MPLIIREENNCSCPLVICDHCGQPITDARHGNYQWRMGKKDSDFGNRIFFTHKKCCKAFEDDHKEAGFRWGAIELACFPIYLGNNLAIDWNQARHIAELFGLQ
jgi:hypothetical protein